ncbi:hypothetical protein SAMN04488058_1086 [Deinococcus reticulitermitis]|uniref:Uncharacterized protein n=1 Tax=Deinococcus reticulitermitis TaxID=856736 RepID=A0A1H6Z3C5_9DEIO|nr:hypothetical protein [Deinococcus reticulitermitis]SEJ43435.1 hypothetical protein SAMN04488058_1086 [Deinococcus reticulitermitis]
MPDPLRPVIGAVGLAIGFGLYALASRLAEPWQSLSVGGFIALLGVAALLYARGERWIQGLGAALILYGLLRAFLLR